MNCSLAATPVAPVPRVARRRLRTALLAGLGPLLLCAPSWAQLVVTDGGLGASSPLSTLDLASGTLTPISGWTHPLGPYAVAADEAGEVLYLADSGGGLWRWPYSDPAPVLVGNNAPAPAQGMTFANGKLYIGFRNLCRTQVYEVEPSTSNATLWFDNFTVAQYAVGLAYDPATDSILSIYHDQGASSGGGCSTAGTGTLGVRVLDPLTQTSTLLAVYPGIETYPTSAAVGGGKLWLHSKFSSVIDNLDLTTLAWDPTPPANPLTYGLGGNQGVTWAPGLTGKGGSGGTWRRLVGSFQGIFFP